jgi:hypothetical protein
MMPFEIQLDEDNEIYRICGPDGEEGELVPYGEIATLKIGDAIYYCDEDAAVGDEDLEVYEVVNVRKMESEELTAVFPAAVIAACKEYKRKLDAEIEKQISAIDATAEEIVEGEDDEEDDEKP